MGIRDPYSAFVSRHAPYLVMKCDLIVQKGNLSAKTYREKRKYRSKITKFRMGGFGRASIIP